MKILILGCGSIGKRHAQNAAELKAEVGLFDLNLEGAAEAASSLGIASFNSLEAALDWKPDGVVIATPHSTHINLAQMAVQAGAHVLIEKPISNTLDGVEALLDAAQMQASHVHVVCNMRYHDAVMAIRDHLHVVGRVLYAKAQYGNYLPNMRPDANYKALYCAHRSAGGGVILDVIHEIDYLMWLLGEVKQTHCVADKISDLDIDVEDFAQINLTHSSGARSSIHVDYLKPYKRRGCEIVGDQGMILWESEGKAPEICSVKVFRTATNAWVDVLNDDALDGNMGYRRLMKAFMMKIEDPKMDTDLSDGYQGLNALRVALAALHSAENGGVGVA